MSWPELLNSDYRKLIRFEFEQIANALGMQEKTVKGHVSAIFRCLNVVHRLQAVEAARAAGLISAVAPG